MAILTTHQLERGMKASNWFWWSKQMTGVQTRNR